MALWSLNDSTITDAGEVLGASAPPGWRVKGTGDLNADTKVDILLQRNFDGAMAVWAMDQRYSPAQAVMSIIPGSDWKLLDSADLIPGLAERDSRGVASLSRP